MSQPPDVFLDTSALFAGLWSATGGARQILQLTEAGLVRVVTSRQVLEEIETVLRRKAPELLGKLVILLDRIELRLAPTALEARNKSALSLTRHPGDARVLADAWASGADFFVTLDRRHYLENKELHNAVPMPMGTPGDFLLWYRKNYIDNQSFVK